MAWVNWNRKATDEANQDGPLLGVDCNATRLRGATGRGNRNRIVLMDDPHLDLPMAISLESRTPELGRAGTGLSRRLPHLSCDGYLPFLGQPREWQAGRHRLDAQDAVTVVLERLRTIASSYAAVSLALPSYLTGPQVARLTALAAKQRLNLNGTVVNALALAADRADKLLAEIPEEISSRKERAAASHRSGVIHSATALIIDADDHALSAALVRAEPEQVRLLGSSSWPRLGIKLWKERLLEALCDRCIRLCRRDPRDSAVAEQEIYDRLDAAMEQARAGRKFALTVRAFHWYQDIEYQPSEFEASCAVFVKQAIPGINELLESLHAVEPPQAVWLTYDAGRLPGLATALHREMPEQTRVSILQPEAIAIAAANLGERRRTGTIPKTHLDTLIPMPMLMGEATKLQPPTAKVRG